jgi:hypothetical protein
MAISLAFISNDAFFHTNRPVRLDEGNCEIVHKGSKARATPFPRPYLAGRLSLA